jgi:tRNA threonylcarbamoyl adenosine modification protein YeaZ
VLLAIDTSAGQCAAALDTGAAVFMRREHMVKGHAERLFPMIEEVLAEARVKIGAIGKVAVCTGPGSFTGLRIGISAARGLALGLGVEAVGVTRLEALAAETREHWPGHPVAVILALRQGTAVVQVFDTDGEPHGAPEILTLEAVPGAIPPLAIRVGDAGLARSVLAHGLADPGVVARLARHRGAVSHPAAPMYLRGADAALPREHPPAILDA